METAPIFPVADGHCDFLYGMVRSGYDIRRPNRRGAQVMALPEMLSGHVALQLFACWIDTSLKASPLHQCISMIDAYRRMLDANAEFAPLTRDFVPAAGKIATVLAVEGGEAIEGSLAALRTLYRLGVRAMTLTWNESNELCGAAMQKNGRGLTPLGKDVVDEMNDLGIALDVSHLSDKGIDDVLNRSTRPVFASHSNARAEYDCPRCLRDEHIREIAGRGGVVGVNFYHKQLTKGASATVADVVRHIRHIADVGGVGCCAIGSDFDGMQKYPEDLGSSADFPALARALLMSGFSEEEVYRILYGNLRGYIGQFV